LPAKKINMKANYTSQKREILAGIRIGIFGKGGSGKSTAVVLLAKVLEDYGYEVLVLDADSTNLGLPQALGIEQSPTPLLEYFGGMIFSGGLVTCPVDDPMPLPGSKVTLDDLPNQYYAKNNAGITLLTAGKIGDQGPGAGCDGPVSKIARDLTINVGGKVPLTLVDFKAGFEDTARGVITSLDWAIVIVDPTVAAVEMAVNMRDMIDQIKNGKLPATQHLENLSLVAIANQMFSEAKIKGALIILNKIQNKEIENYLKVKLDERGIHPIGIIHEHPTVAFSWLKGIPLVIPEADEDLHRIVEELEAIESAYIQSEIQ
jgi:CO dehydrogenase nickel-insertion accessory protein CooC1